MTSVVIAITITIITKVIYYYELEQPSITESIKMEQKWH